MVRSKTDELFMARAISLARRGLYGTHPNPMVGAVLVRNGRVIGEGWHREFGEAHAEINALRSAKGPVKGATAYVTLEPCSTYGKTGPCTEALKAAGIGRVVYGAADPNPAHRGRGARILRSAGIEVTPGVMEKETRALNPAFFKLMKTGLPYITLKAAQSLDGKIADPQGRSRWISSERSRAEAHRLRAEADAVLAGIGTVLADDPQLNVRGVGVKRQPATVVLDSDLRIPPRARVFGNERVIIAAARGVPPGRVRRVSGGNVRVLLLPRGKDGGVDLKALLRALGRLGIAHVLVEGGGRVLGSFISQGLFDRFMLFCCPLVIGGERSKSSVVWPDGLGMRGRLGIPVKTGRIRKVGPDILLEITKA